MLNGVLEVRDIPNNIPLLKSFGSLHHRFYSKIQLALMRSNNYRSIGAIHRVLLKA